MAHHCDAHCYSWCHSPSIIEWISLCQLIAEDDPNVMDRSKIERLYFLILSLGPSLSLQPSPNNGKCRSRTQWRRRDLVMNYQELRNASWSSRLSSPCIPWVVYGDHALMLSLDIDATAWAPWMNICSLWWAQHSFININPWTNSLSPANI